MRVFCLGEAMGEISLSPDAPAQVSVGGDVFNTAVYLAHLGVPTSFISAVGEDPFGQNIRRALDHHGIEASHLGQGDDSTGIYTISTDPAGERSFHYWRAQAPARHMLHGRDLDALAQVIGKGILYLSGISLWVLRADLPRLVALLEAVRGQGGQIVFDGNFRPRLWGAERALPAEAARAVLRRATLALLTQEDEQALWGDTTPKATLARVQAEGCGTVVVKRGQHPCLFADGAHQGAVPVPTPLHPVDTTAAGDSFNAGFLSCWLDPAKDIIAAVQAGHHLAAKVIRHRGAILPDPLLKALKE